MKSFFLLALLSFSFLDTITADAASAASIDHLECRKRKAEDDSLKNSTAKLAKKDTDFSEEKCPICLDNITTEKAIKLPSKKITKGGVICGHTLHETCLREWMKRKKVCPTCITPITITFPYSLRDLFESGYTLPVPVSILHTLSIKKRNLTSLEGSDALPKEHIVSLNLGSNRIQSVPPAFFTKFTNLKHLSFYGNCIEELQPGMFENAPNLEILILAFNKLKSIPPRTFTGLSKLKELSLYGNKIRTKTSIADDAFKLSDDEKDEKCVPLQTLTLGNNEALFINTKALVGLSTLKELKLTRNRIYDNSRVEIIKSVPEQCVVTF